MLPRKTVTHGHDNDWHDNDSSDNDWSDNDSDVDGYLVTWSGRTLNEIKAGKPFYFPTDRRTTIVTHVIRNPYTVKCPPSLPAFLDLFLSQLNGDAALVASHRIARRCLDSLMGEIHSPLSYSTSHGLVRDGLDNQTHVSVALIESVIDGQFNYGLIRSGALQDMHANRGRCFRTIVPGDDALPASKDKLFAKVMDHLVRTRALSESKEAAMQLPAIATTPNLSGFAPW